MGQFARGYTYSGSHAGRNIDVMYRAAVAANVPVSLQDAVTSCFQVRNVRHVMVCSGFFVLHDFAPQRPEITAGSCETDGPLGALALVRAFAARGVHVSLFCDVHNGPVIRAGYEAMLRYFEDVDTEMLKALTDFSRCLPFVSSSAFARFDSPDSKPAEQTDFARARLLAERLGQAIQEAWHGASPGPVDCLFALERLGAPYRNIRGHDLSRHTEPIDSLWPLLDPITCTGSIDAGSARDLAAYCARHDFSSDSHKALRRLAGILEDALSLGVGDGGNEVGLGNVAHMQKVVQLSPGGEFAPLSVNGCYRCCDHLLLSTVSNWAGSAFELAAHVLFESRPVDYVSRLQSSGRNLADLDMHLLTKISEPPVFAVDGVHPSKRSSVDGMDFDKCHKPLLNMLWHLALNDSKVM